MTHKLLSIAIVVTASFACGAAAAAATDRPTDRPCFASNNWDGWNASADGDALYLRVSMRDIYRVELTVGSHVRKDGFRFLINQVRGSNWLCSPPDLDLTLSDHNGFREPLIARSLRKLTPAEIAAIP